MGLKVDNSVRVASLSPDQAGEKKCSDQEQTESSPVASRSLGAFQDPLNWMLAYDLFSFTVTCHSVPSLGAWMKAYHPPQDHKLEFGMMWSLPLRSFFKKPFLPSARTLGRMTVTSWNISTGGCRSPSQLSPCGDWANSVHWEPVKQWFFVPGDIQQSLEKIWVNTTWVFSGRVTLASSE